jgi:SAM-dependent methyltransferase
MCHSGSPLISQDMTPTTCQAGPAFTVLHLGAGRRKTPEDIGFKLTGTDGSAYGGELKWLNLDGNASVNPDVLCWLGKDPIPLPDNSVDLVIAFHVIEHIGDIGKTEEWFYFWQEIYRVMKPGARLQFECPYATSIWAWADPTHVRAISEYTFIYLNQDAYTVGGSIPDYRPPFDFQLGEVRLRPDPVNDDVREKEAISFINGVLTARKPLNPYWERG